MKTKKFVIGWALIVLLVGVCSVQAGTILSYDFDNLSNGSILGQDNWAAVPVAWNWDDFTVDDVVGADGNTSKAIRQNSAVSTLCNAGNYRDWPTSVSFTSADTAVWQSFQFKLDSSTDFHELFCTWASPPSWS